MAEDILVDVQGVHLWLDPMTPPRLRKELDALVTEVKRGRTVIKRARYVAEDATPRKPDSRELYPGEMIVQGEGIKALKAAFAELDELP